MFAIFEDATLEMLWVFLHIFIIVAAVVAAFGTQIFLERAAHTKDVQTIRSVFRIAKPMGMLIPVLFVIGGVLGVVAFLDRGVDWNEPWLIQSYVLFAVAFILGGAVEGRWQTKVTAAVEEAPDGPVSEELQALLDDRVNMIATWIGRIVVVAIFYVMTMKPFS